MLDSGQLVTAEGFLWNRPDYGHVPPRFSKAFRKATMQNVPLALTLTYHSNDGWYLNQNKVAGLHNFIKKRLQHRCTGKPCAMPCYISFEIYHHSGYTRCSGDFKNTRFSGDFKNTINMPFQYILEQRHRLLLNFMDITRWTWRLII